MKPTYTVNDRSPYLDFKIVYLDSEKGWSVSVLDKDKIVSHTTCADQVNLLDTVKELLKEIDEEEKTTNEETCIKHNSSNSSYFNRVRDDSPGRGYHLSTRGN